jgi:AbiV family abortive infection protein
MPTGAYRALKQYTGPLDAKQIAEGMRAAIKNAQRLFRDAETLVGLGRYPTATALAILCLEETGKVRLLRSFAWSRDEDDLDGHWRDFRKHTAKTVDAARWAFPGNLVEIAAEWRARGTPMTQEFLERASRRLASNLANSKHLPHRFEKAKQLAFYVDCLTDGDTAGPIWSEPMIASDRARAEHYLETARKVVPVHDVDDREVELWVRYVGQVARSVAGDPKDPADVIKFLEALATSINGYCSDAEALGVTTPWPMSLVRSLGDLVRIGVATLKAAPPG